MHGRASGLTMIHTISSEMKRRLVSQIQTANTKIGVLADEATTIGKKPVVIVFLKFCIGMIPQLAILALAELANRGAEAVADAVENFVS